MVENNINMYIFAHNFFNVNGRVPSKQNIMAVKIRLSRRGRKKLAIYDIVVADARSPRDGKIIEKIYKLKNSLFSGSLEKYPYFTMVLLSKMQKIP